MMSDPNDLPLRYSHVAPMYWEAGWRGIFPLEHGRKGGKEARIPPGFSGRTGKDTSYADIMQWTETRGDGNLALRLGGTDDFWVIGIDVDNYNSKNGGATMEEATRRWGDLPPAPRSTSRADDPISGIRLFKIPFGEELEEGISFADLGLGDIEIVQRHHRYVVAWPSLHPEGRTYWWYDDNQNVIDIPNINDLNDLPDRWLQGLRVKPRASLDQAAGVDYDVQQALTTGDMSRAVLDRLRGAAKELSGPGVCHHDCVRKHTLAMLHLGKSGEPGVRPALEQLGTMFVELVEDSRDGGADEATTEFKALIFGRGAGQSLNQVDFLDRPRGWVDEVRDDPKVGGPPARQRINAERCPSTPAQPGGAVIEDTSGDAARYTSHVNSHIEDIERGFWDSRDSLKQIFEASLFQMCSPWAVLAGCAGRALTLVRPHVTLPALIGGRGSLNWFAAITAQSGGGKGASMAVARELVPQFVYQRNLGSGEGMVTQFQTKQDDENPDGIRESVMFVADEIDNVSALGGRSGSTLLGTLRSAFSGEALGFSYATKGRDFHLESHSYRLTFICSVQPRRAGALLGDDAGGTPQRFMWFPGADSRIKRPTGSMWISPLNLPSLNEWLYPRELKVPDVLKDCILDERAKAMSGQQDALDGHALYCREKFAFALAMFDGRAEITAEDWELSGIAADVSTFTREAALDAIRDEAQREAVARGELRGVEMEAADVEKLQAQIKRGQRVLRWLLHKLDAAGPEGMRQGELAERIASRDRQALTAILLAGHEALKSETVDGTIRWFRA